MSSIRTRLLMALLALVVAMSLLTGGLTYQRVLAETSTLFDYQLRQMALSLVNEVSLAPRLELPSQPQSGTDFVIEIWDLLGEHIYYTRPGLPILDRPRLGYANVRLQGRLWRVYGMQTLDGVIDVGQPQEVREGLARAAALHVVLPLLVLLPILAAAIAWVVGGSLRPLRRVAAEVQRRDVHSLTPVGAGRLPEEVAPLIHALNRLLSRLDGAFATQRAFIADAAHELRSPLTAVRLHLQLLDRAPDEAAHREAREQLGAAVERAIHLLEQLLTLARNEPQDTRDRPLAPVSLHEASIAALADTHPLALARNIELTLQARSQAIVRGDADALRILIRNLVDNAARYTPAGGHVLVQIDDLPSGAVLQVTDTGPGIPPAERDRAFDRFHRRANAPEGGCGLGLAIVRAIVDRHSAQISLGDAPGGGLLVTVHFPPLSTVTP